MSYDVSALRADQFPITRRLAYLDNGTLGPPPRACVEAAGACLRELSVGARLPVPWAAEVERVRGLAARLIGVDADDVAFVKSSSEGIGLVALGLDWRPGDEVVPARLPCHSAATTLTIRTIASSSGASRKPGPVPTKSPWAEGRHAGSGELDLPCLRSSATTCPTSRFPASPRRTGSTAWRSWLGPPRRPASTP